MLFGGIRTRNPSKRTAADPRLGPHGHWDRHCKNIHEIIKTVTTPLFNFEKPAPCLMITSVGPHNVLLNF